MQNIGKFIFLFLATNEARSVKLSNKNKILSLLLMLKEVSSPLISYILGGLNLLPLFDFFSISKDVIVGICVNVSKDYISVNKLSLNLFKDSELLSAVFDFILKCLNKA